MATAFGTGFPDEVKKVSALPLTTTWEGVSVSITIPGHDPVAGYPLYMQGKTQFAFIVPSNTPVGAGTFTVTVGNATSAPAPITILASNFGAFTTNFTGQGPGVLLDPDGANAIGMTYTANPGEMFDIWGTGLGPVNATTEAATPLAGDLASADVKVTVGGLPATVVYKGRSGCCIGLDQIRIIIPSGTTGCFVPAVVTTNGQPSNFFTLSIAAAGERSCSDPNGLTTDDVNALVNGGTRRIGALDVARSVISGSRTTTADRASAQFLEGGYSQMANSNLGILFQPTGSCIVYKGEPTSDFKATDAKALDAGTQLSLTGPNGTKTLAKDPQTGSYSATLSLSSGWLDPGTYTFAGAGGPDVLGFTAQLTLPTAPVWTNVSSISSVVRSAGQTFTWTGGDPDGILNIGGYSSTADAGLTFLCRAKASAGSFTVPPEVLLSLPVTPAGASATMAYLFGGAAKTAAFAVSGIDHGVFLATVSDVVATTFH